MSSYLTGWESDEKPCIQDIYKLQLVQSSPKAIDLKKIGQQRVCKVKSESKMKKYFFPIKRNSITSGSKPIPKRIESFSIATELMKKAKFAFTAQTSVNKKFLKNKQNWLSQLCKKNIKMRKQSMKTNLDVKFSVVNVFERLDFKKPTESRYQNVSRKKELSFSKSIYYKKKSRSSQKIKSKSNSTQKLDILHTRCILNIKQWDCLPHQSVHQKIHSHLPSVKKIYKSSSDYCLKKLR